MGFLDLFFVVVEPFEFRVNGTALVLSCFLFGLDGEIQERLQVVPVILVDLPEPNRLHQQTVFRDRQSIHLCETLKIEKPETIQGNLPVYDIEGIY